MGEINQRWARSNRLDKRLTVYGLVLAPILWSVSYYASFSAEGVTFHGIWVGFSSAALFFGAVGTTIATVIGIGTVLTDEPPLNGDNR